MMFLQIADGVDDATWLHHLRRNDYSRWFEEMIGDSDLAAAAERIERQHTLSPSESRKAVAEAVNHRYTVPT